MIIDEFTRETIWINTARLLKSNDMVCFFQQPVEVRGVSGVIESDHCPDLVCDLIQAWIKERGFATKFIEPGSSCRNGCSTNCSTAFSMTAASTDGFLCRFGLCSSSSSAGAANTTGSVLMGRSGRLQPLRMQRRWSDSGNGQRPEGQVKVQL